MAHDPSNPLNLLVLGGSLGSSFLNTHVPIVAAVIASLGIALEIHHQTGERDLNHTRDRYLALGLKPARVLPFISDMTGAYGNADFVISCAGASSLAEFAIAGLPCLLVPLASASENHQVANAEIFSHETGVPWVTEAQWKTVEIARLITLLVNAPTKWTNLSHQLRRQARTNSAALLVDDMLDLAIWRSSPAVSAP